MAYTLEELIAQLHKLPQEAMDKPVALLLTPEAEVAFIDRVEYDLDSGTTFLHEEQES